jgi:hypothetical protein
MKHWDNVVLPVAVHTLRLKEFLATVEAEVSLPGQQQLHLTVGKGPRQAGLALASDSALVSVEPSRQQFVKTRFGGSIQHGQFQHASMPRCVTAWAGTG